jgi:imidazole glycerol-phosphate synthase subunit HisH
MIDVLDYGLGNIKSIIRMLQKAGAPAKSISTPDEVHRSTKMILPGVGHFDSGMAHIKKCGLQAPLRIKVMEEKIPILGICLGMQLLCLHSEEGVLPGLGFVEADVRSFDTNTEHKLKVPNMGWNTLNIVKDNNILCNNMESKFYFVHSYYVQCRISSNILATAFYGDDFVAAFQSENIYGVQFHPEKSHKYGLNVMKRFSEL